MFTGNTSHHGLDISRAAEIIRHGTQAAVPAGATWAAGLLLRLRSNSYLDSLHLVVIGAENLEIELVEGYGFILVRDVT